MKINYKVFNIIVFILAFIGSRIVGNILGYFMKEDSSLIPQITLSLLAFSILAVVLYYTNRRFKLIKSYNIPLNINTRAIPFIGIVVVILMVMFYFVMNIIMAIMVSALVITAVINVMIDHKEDVIVDESEIYFNGRLIPLKQVIDHSKEDNLLKLRIEKPFLFISIIEDLELPIKTETYMKLQAKL